MPQSSTIRLTQLMREVNPDMKVMHAYVMPFQKQFSVLSKKSTTKFKKSLYTVKLFIDTPKMTPTSKVKAFCTCLDFTYRLAYCLSTKNALYEEPNFVLKHPSVTNPGCNIRGCQHIDAAIRYGLRKGI